MVLKEEIPSIVKEAEAHKQGAGVLHKLDSLKPTHTGKALGLTQTLPARRAQTQHSLLLPGLGISVSTECEQVRCCLGKRGGERGGEQRGFVGNK